MEFAVLPSAAVRTKQKQEDPITESVTNSIPTLVRLWSMGSVAEEPISDRC
jgi:hypothetical protein